MFERQETFLTFFQVILLDAINVIYLIGLMKLEKQITFKVPATMGKRLDNLAKEEGLSISDVIRLALKKALEPHSTSFFAYKSDLKNHIKKATTEN